MSKDENDSSNAMIMMTIPIEEEREKERERERERERRDIIIMDKSRTMITQEIFYGRAKRHNDHVWIFNRDRIVLTIGTILTELINEQASINDASNGDSIENSGDNGNSSDNDHDMVTESDVMTTTTTTSKEDITTAMMMMIGTTDADRGTKTTINTTIPDLTTATTTSSTPTFITTPRIKNSITTNTIPPNLVNNHSNNHIMTNTTINTTSTTTITTTTTTTTTTMPNTTTATTTSTANTTTTTSTTTTTTTTPSKTNKTCFHAKAVPRISIKDYLIHISNYIHCSDECFIYALIYIDKINEIYSEFILDKLNVHRVILLSLIIAAKFHDDKYYTNKYYAHIGGIALQELILLEKEYLFNYIDFKLYINQETYEMYYNDLSKYYRQKFKRTH